MKDVLKLGGIIGGAMLVAILLAGYFNQPVPTLSGAGNLQASVATTSTIGVGPQENKTLFSTNSFCANRTISTVASAVMISFGSSVTPSGIDGHVLAASSTNAFDSSLYGCRAITAYAFSSTTITISGFNQ